MVKIDTNSQNQTNQTETCGTTSQTQSQKSGLVDIIGSLLPFAPLAFEQFTGQKVPQLSGTMADIQMALNNLQLTQTQIINSQNQIWKEIESLKSNAVQQLTSLSKQFNSLRLTHTQETKLSETQKKQIEFNPNPNKQLENEY